MMSIYKFSHHDVNRFALLLQKDAYPNECMDITEKKSMKHPYQREMIFSHSNTLK